MTVGDDTPAPTDEDMAERPKCEVCGDWAVWDGTGWAECPDHDPSVPPGDDTPVAAAVNRAGAAPDLTALPTAEQVDAAARALYEEAWPGRTPWVGAGEAQDIYRRRARVAFAAVAALVREDTDHD